VSKYNLMKHMPPAMKHYYAPAPIAGALSDDARLTSDICLSSVAYIGPKSRTERPRKTKIGTIGHT